MPKKKDEKRNDILRRYLKNCNNIVYSDDEHEEVKPEPKPQEVKPEPKPKEVKPEPKPKEVKPEPNEYRNEVLKQYHELKELFEKEKARLQNENNSLKQTHTQAKIEKDRYESLQKNLRNMARFKQRALVKFG